MKRSSLFIAILLLSAGVASAQTGQERLDAVSAHMQRIQNLSARLPASAKMRLSSGAQHLLYMAGKWDEIGPQLSGSIALNTPLKPRAAQVAPTTLPLGKVSDPSMDLVLSRLAGFTQSETSTAWCGRHVVVGYNDSGSIIETFFSPGIGLSFNGYSLSTDAGRSFTDLGFLNPGPSVLNFLQGDPVVACSDENTFYYSSVFSSTLVTTEVSVSKSTDGGRTFGDPVSAVSKDAFTHVLDKPWMTVDPSDARNIYVTYADFDFTGTVCPFQGFNIELVRSTDGGATWSAPTVVDSACFPDGNQGSTVAVDGAGNVFVAWEHFPAGTATNEIAIARSNDHGASFAPKVVAAVVLPVGSPSGGTLQGGFRNNEFPSLAIDRSRRPGNGPLYLAWNDGRLGATPDFVGGSYNFGDVFVSRSDDGGATWSSAVRVNAASSTPADHYLPGIAVDRYGSVGICFYDRHRDPDNFFIDRQCAHSRDGGVTWRNHRITKRSFAASIAADQLINPVYMGDYDTVAADSTRAFHGFLGSYGDNTGGNPDVKISRRFGQGEKEHEGRDD